MPPTVWTGMCAHKNHARSKPHKANMHGFTAYQSNKTLQTHYRAIILHQTRRQIPYFLKITTTKKFPHSKKFHLIKDIPRHPAVLSPICIYTALRISCSSRQVPEDWKLANMMPLLKRQEGRPWKLQACQPDLSAGKDHGTDDPKQPAGPGQ